MRDYVLSRAHGAEATGSGSMFGQLIRNWQARRAVARMDRLDDHMLRDIGITREDLRWAAGLPLTVNAALWRWTKEHGSRGAGRARRGYLPRLPRISRNRSSTEALVVRRRAAVRVLTGVVLRRLRVRA